MNVYSSNANKLIALALQSPDKWGEEELKESDTDRSRCCAVVTGSLFEFCEGFVCVCEFDACDLLF